MEQKANTKNANAKKANTKNANAKNEEAEGKGDLSRKDYMVELRKLQTELVHLQEWVKQAKQRIVIVFEGRDAAGKGGLIRAITERVSPRVFRIVALPAPSDREKSMLYMQRYINQFPAGGEIVIFDRSWYNRAGVEYVMGFCTEQQRDKFLRLAPAVERTLIDEGIILIKYWLEVSSAEQKRRFEDRIEDPMRQWKLSVMDLPSRKRWYDYSLARDTMLNATDTEVSPWHIVRSDDKRRARLNCITDLLSRIPYERISRPKVKLPKRADKHAYDDDATMVKRRWIAEKY
jgi:polyphosphate kinase 2